MKYQLLETTPLFSFSKENLAKIKKLLNNYPESFKQSAVLPCLDLAQRQNEGWLSKSCIEAVGKALDMPFMRVYEIATFYSMFNLSPVGKYLVQFCRTTPCWLRGAEDVESACKSHLQIGMNESTQDGLFTLKQVECLGACVDAPVVQINDDYYENLTPQSAIDLLERFRSQHVG